MSKKWYLSKTVWVTLMMYASEAILLATQTLSLSPEVLTTLAFINGLVTLALRFLTTEPIEF